VFLVPASKVGAAETVADRLVKATASVKLTTNP
jgi:hypothetical protein